MVRSKSHNTFLHIHCEKRRQMKQSLGLVAWALNPSTREVEAGKSWGEDWLWLHGEFLEEEALTQVYTN